MADAPTAPRASLERFVPVLLAFIVLAEVLLAWRFLGAVAGSSDSSGYLNSARLLASGELVAPIRPVEGLTARDLPDYLDEMAMPLGFRPALRNGTLSPTYPIGLPLLVVAAAKITGWKIAPGLVMLLHAAIGILLMYVLSRRCGLPSLWSLLGSLVLAVSPLYYGMSTWLMSDLPALVWVTAGILAAWRARSSPGWALAAGFTLGFAALVRPTNALALVPAVIALGVNWRRVVLLAVGGLPAAAVLLGYNFRVYGGAFTTGYGDSSSAFGLHNILPTLGHYVLWFPALLTPLVLAAPALFWTRGVGGELKRILGTWVLVFSGFYVAYVFTRETWWFSRFVLPAFPPLIVASLLVIRGWAERKPHRLPSNLHWAIAAVAIFLHGWSWTHGLYARGLPKMENSYPTMANWMQTHVPPETVVFAMQNSGALFYYTDFSVVRWDWLNPEQFRSVVPRVRAAGRPIYAVLWDFELDRAFQHLPGKWVKVERLLFQTVWRLEP